MKMRKETIITGTILILLLSLTYGCGKEKIELPEEKYTLDSALKEQGIQTQPVKVTGNSVDVTYEASNADEYDTQMIADWAGIFVNAQEFGYDPITITNTINDVPYVRMKTTNKNVADFVEGNVNETVFWMNVELTAMK
jgi:hypothetical protein